LLQDNLEKAKGLLTWLSSRNIPLTTQSLDIILGILTRAKEDVTTDLHEELTGILALYATYSLCPSYYTFHSLLSYYAAQGNLNKANEIIKLMKLWDYEPDTVSYNILLRLCINRISTQKVVSKELVNSIVAAIPDSNNEITQSLLIQLYTALKDEQG
jgi:pentatricopeptide repeat protein